MGLIVHHLNASQSERIPWLCEELGIEYELKLYKRSPAMAPPEYKALHRNGTAPVIQHDGLTLAETCACIEYICHKLDNGNLFLTSEHPAYADFLFWWHWVDGTFQPAQVQALAPRPGAEPDEGIMAKVSLERFYNSLEALDERLRDNEWLAGSDFTVADIMVMCPLTTMRSFFVYSLEKYPNLVKYIRRLSQRPAYKKAMEKCDPELKIVLSP